MSGTKRAKGKSFPKKFQEIKESTLATVEKLQLRRDAALEALKVCPHCGRCQHCGTAAPVNPFTSYIINSGTATATPLQTTWTMNTAQFNS